MIILILEMRKIYDECVMRHFIFDEISNFIFTLNRRRSMRPFKQGAVTFCFLLLLSPDFLPETCITLRYTFFQQLILHDLYNNSYYFLMIQNFHNAGPGGQGKSPAIVQIPIISV